MKKSLLKPVSAVLQSCCWLYAITDWDRAVQNSESGDTDFEWSQSEMPLKTG